MRQDASECIVSVQYFNFTLKAVCNNSTMNPILLLYSLCSTLALQTSFAKCLSALGPIAILGHSQAPWYGQVQGDIWHFQKKPTNVFYLSSQVLLIISNIENYFLDLIPFTKMNYYIPLVTLSGKKPLPEPRASSFRQGMVYTMVSTGINRLVINKFQTPKMSKTVINRF